MSPDDELTPLDPDYRKVLRLRGAIQALVLIGLAIAAELLLPGPFGLSLAVGVMLGLWLALISPARKFNRWGYQLSADRLRVVSGWLFRSDTVVPLGRVQHINLDQGPLMRRWDLAELTVHTAGSHGASVSLPGLKRSDAVAMREAIREQIRDRRA
jgi:membrane protein YdbS with pleckstrin-like domain